MKELVTKETPYSGYVGNGFVYLFLLLAVLGAAAFSFATAHIYTSALYYTGAVLIVLAIILCCGFTSMEPKEAKVLVFFGKYRGTLCREDFYFVNPFISRKSVNYRARNLNPDPIKVNDKAGNPVMIGMMLVWQLEDSYKAMFEIDAQNLAKYSAQLKSKGDDVVSPNISSAFESFVSIQSDAALRQVAGCYAYDNAADSEELTLRSNAEEINEHLVRILNDRLALAGMRVVEARINYLAYAPEIAATMLRRQQADAIIAAREKIVNGAVSMVKMALGEIEEQGIVELDPERKAAMVSNLLVVLCGDQPASPVINSGTLY